MAESLTFTMLADYMLNYPLKCATASKEVHVSVDISTKNDERIML